MSEPSSVRARETISPLRTDFYALAQLTAAGASSLLLALAVLFAARRVTGGMQVPLPPGAVLLVGAMLIGIASALRIPWTSRSIWRTSPVGAWLGFTAPLAIVLLLAAAISLPDTATWSLVLMWIGVLAHESAWGAWWWRNRRVAGPLHPPSVQRPAATRVPESESVQSPLAEEVEHDTHAATTPHQVTQQITRSREADGGESIAGLLRADFVIGERTKALHVAFCPPLSEPPSFHCEQIDGPAARITVAEVQSYGARVDVRLSQSASEPTSVVVEFYAH